MHDALATNALIDCLERRDLIVCVGSGGVGKTTTAAALGLAAALRGRSVLVLTIDPAKRLLQALGLPTDGAATNEPLEVLPRLADQLNLPAGAPLPRLDAMMLDPERGADQMFAAMLPDAAERDQVLGNRVYRALVPILNAAPDYVALDLIARLHESGSYDLLVLDTPPTHNALDFVRAGSTLSSFINERVLAWFARVPGVGGKRRSGILARGSSLAMGLFGRLFGADVLVDIAGFFASFTDVLPRLKARTQQTDALLRADQTRFIAVTAPGETSLREARHLFDVLKDHELAVAGFVVNRVVEAPESIRGDAGRKQAVSKVIEQMRGTGMDQASADRLGDLLAQGAARMGHLDASDRNHVDALRSSAAPGVFCSVVAQLEHDIHALPELRDLGERLLAGLRSPVVLESAAPLKPQ